MKLLALLVFVQTGAGQAQTSIEKPLAPSVKLPLLENLRQRTDELRFDRFLEHSTVEASQFRKGLLQESPDKPSRAVRIAKATVEFRRAMESRVQSATNQDYSLKRFRQKPEQIVAAIRGTGELPDPKSFYGSFQGRWYGIWDKQKVDHNWGPFVPVRKTFGKKDDAVVRLLGYQYAWVGDGYGLNHVCSSADKRRRYLLGYVVHIRDKDPEKEVVRRPHVGVVDGPTRLIWITRSEVFFEEAVSEKLPARYYITGFRYDWVDHVVQPKEGFLAVYSRDPKQRQPWRRLDVSYARQK